MLAEPLEGAQPRLLTVQMVPGPDVPHSFIYLYEQPWGGCWVPDVSSFAQGSFVSLSDVQSKITSCYCPELVTRPGCPYPVQATRHIFQPRLTSPLSSPEGFIPLSPATVLPVGFCHISLLALTPRAELLLLSGFVWKKKQM